MSARRFILPCLVITACCPSIWLTVTQRHRGPRVAVPIPEIANPPFVYPPQIANRFDVLRRGEPPEEMTGFVDAIDPRDESIAELTVAVTAAEAIRETFGRSRYKPFDITVSSTCYPAEDTCEAEDGEDCQDLTFDTVVPQIPVVAHIKGPDWAVNSVIESCEGRREKDPAPGEPRSPPPDCGSHPSKGTYLMMSTPFPNTDGPIEVCVSIRYRLSETIYSFIQLSDVQLRDPDVKLEDAELSARLDWIVQSFEHDDEQEFYNPYLLEAMIATINEIVATSRGNDKPRLMIHTGDSVDAGTISELKDFHRIVDRLTIPWFNALGNHDILVFGNMLPSTGEDDDASCVGAETIAEPYEETKPIRWMIPNKLCVRPKIECKHCGENGAEEYIAKTTHEESRQAFIDGMAHPDFVAVAQPPVPDDPDNPGKKKRRDPWPYEIDGRKFQLTTAPASRFHGFDIDTPTRLNKSQYDGYYAFVEPIELDGKPRDLVFIVLNTEDLEEGKGGNSGRVGSAQARWLEATLAVAKKHKALIMVFGHHGLGEIKVDEGPSIEELLDAATPNVIAFIYGHHHVNGLCREKRATTCSKYWEIEGGSLIEFPQEGRMIRIKSIGEGIGYLEVVTFTERLADNAGLFGEYVRNARRGAERDHCRTELSRCTEDLRPFRRDAVHGSARLFFKFP